MTASILWVAVPLSTAPLLCTAQAEQLPAGRILDKFYGISFQVSQACRLIEWRHLVVGVFLCWVQKGARLLCQYTFTAGGKTYQEKCALLLTNCFNRSVKSVALKVGLIFIYDWFPPLFLLLVLSQFHTFSHIKALEFDWLSIVDHCRQYWMDVGCSTSVVVICHQCSFLLRSQTSL